MGAQNTSWGYAVMNFKGAIKPSESGNESDNFAEF